MYKLRAHRVQHAVALADIGMELRAEARRAEDRITKLTEMLDKLGVKMADPKVYDDPVEVKKWGRKHAEATEAMTRAEALWMKALERLERAERG